MQHVDLSYLADTLLTVQLRPGGASYDLRNPSALESDEMGELYKLPTEQERTAATHRFFSKLMPDAPLEEIQSMPKVQMLKLMAVVALAINAVAKSLAEDELPNGKAGPMRPSSPATPSAISSGALPAPPDATYGPS